MPVKVLIAHGNTQRLKQAVTDLHAAGFDVVATPDGGDAFARFFEEMPEVVICSQVLPSLNGENIAQMVRAQSPDTQMVLLTEDPALQSSEGVKVILEPMTLAKLRDALPDIAFEAPPSPEDNQADLTAISPTRVFVHAVLKRFQRDNRALQSLDDAGIGKMAAIAENRNFQENELIIRQGDPGDGFYLVCEGQVRVTLAEKEDKEVARISAGGFFGEMAMLLDQKRSASVWSVGPTTLLWFGKEVFMPILAEYPGMREVLSGVALKRTEENLWRVLFDDDEVQRSLAQLDEANTAAKAVQPVEEDIQAPTQTVPSPVKKIEKAAFTKTIAPSAVLEPATAPVARSPFDKYRFQIGLAAGFAGGLLAGLLMSPSKEEAATATEKVTIQKIDKAPEQSTKVPPAPVPVPASPPATAGSGAAAASGTSASEDAGATPAVALKPDGAAKPDGTAKPDATPAKSEAEPTEPKGVVETAIAINEAYKAADYKRVLQLAKKNPTDADSLYMIADSKRHMGQPDALQAYLDFAKAHPEHGRADDAQYWAADLLNIQGKKDEARALFQKVASNEKSNFRNSAVKRLEK